MFKLNQQQLDHLDRLSEDRVIDRLVQHLRQVFPVETDARADDTLRRFVVQGIGQAASVGVINAFDVQRFLEYMVRYGSMFMSRPDLSWITHILTDPELPGRVKMDRIDSRDLFS